MATIRYILDKKSTERALILLSIPRSDGRLIKFSIGRHTDPRLWDVRLRRCRTNLELNMYLDTLLTQVSKYYDQCLTRYCAIDDRIKDDIIKIINPVLGGKPPRTYDLTSYFGRFYELVGTYDTMKAAYEAVESEWNAQGIQQCITYESFKVAKNRFMRGNRQQKTKLLHKPA